MTDHPMRFKVPMVRALLDGRKVQDRRIIKGMPVFFDHPKIGGWEPATLGGGGAFQFKGGQKVAFPEIIGICHQTSGYCLAAPIQIGDRIWVRETWRGVVAINPPWAPDEYGIARYTPDREHCLRIEYKATQEPDNEPYRPSVHMPRWASRLTLAVTHVRAQRLHDISEEDARAEGADRLVCDGIRGDEVRFYHDERGTHQAGFAGLWAHTYGADSWDANPWIWALTFEVLRRNVDEVSA